MSGEQSDTTTGQSDRVVLNVETAPFPQTIECPRCGQEHRVLIQDESIGGVQCENADCKATIVYRHSRQTEGSEPDHEQQTLVADGGDQA